MAVDEGVQAGGVGNDLPAGPRLGGLVHPQVAQGDDVVGLNGSRVDGLLDRVVQFLTIWTAGDALDVVAVVILEVGGGDLVKDSGVVMPMMATETPPSSNTS